MKPQAPQSREPGRSVSNRARPLGEELLDRSRSTTPPTTENFESREAQAARQAAEDAGGVAGRAKVIGVLRKAEEFMSTGNPAPSSDADVRRALELGAGRLGLTYGEYRALTDADPELVELERRVTSDARERWGIAAPPPTVVAAPSGVEPTTEESDRTIAESVFARVFVPIDYTMASHRALAVAFDLRKSHDSALCLFHAAQSTGSDDWLGGIGSPSVGGDWVAESKERLRRFVGHVAPGEDHDVEVHACIGSQVSSIGDEARRWGATLVVVAASLQPTFIRSPAERILRELRLPVLILPTG